MRRPKNRLAGAALAILLFAPWTGPALADCLDDLVAAGLKIKTIGIRGAVPVTASDTGLDLERVVPVLSVAPGRPRRAMIIGMAGEAPLDCVLRVRPARFQVIIDTSSRNQTRPVAGTRSRLAAGTSAAGSSATAPDDGAWTSWIALATEKQADEPRPWMPRRGPR